MRRAFGLVGALVIGACAAATPAEPPEITPNSLATSTQTPAASRSPVATPAPTPQSIVVRVVPDAPVDGEKASVEVSGLLGGQIVRATWPDGSICCTATVDNRGVVRLDFVASSQADRRSLAIERNEGRWFSIGTAVVAAQKAGAGASARPTQATSVEGNAYDIGDGVTQNQVRLIQDAITIVSAYHRLVFGGTRTGARIHIIASKTRDPRPPTAVGCCVELGGGDVWIDVDDPDWLAMSDARRQTAAAHEFTHAYQDGLGAMYGCIGRDSDNPKRTPVWFYEGWAEFVAYQSMLRAGVVTQRDVAAIVPRAKDDATVSSLRRLSVPPLRGARGLSTLAYVAADRLTSIRGPEAVRDFCLQVAQGTDWHVAFSSAFGLDGESFMDTFNAYVLALP